MLNTSQELVSKSKISVHSEPIELSSSFALFRMVSYTKGPESLYPQVKYITYCSRFTQVTMVYLNAYMGPNRLTLAWIM